MDLVGLVHLHLAKHLRSGWAEVGLRHVQVLGRVRPLYFLAETYSCHLVRKPSLRRRNSRPVSASSVWAASHRIDSCSVLLAAAHSERSLSHPVLEAEVTSSGMSVTVEVVAMAHLISLQAYLVGSAPHLSTPNVVHLRL